MTDSQTNEPDIEDRGANIRMTIQSIIDSGLDAMFDRFDALKKRNINDDDVVAALRYLGDIELLDSYAEWGDIDIREDDNTTMNPVVPDPDNPSYAPLLAQLQEAENRRVAEALVKELHDEDPEVILTGNGWMRASDGPEEVQIDGTVNFVALVAAARKAMGK